MTELGVSRAQSLTADCGGWTKTELHLVRETRGGGLRSLAPAPTADRARPELRPEPGMTPGTAQAACAADQEMMAVTWRGSESD